MTLLPIILFVLTVVGLATTSIINYLQAKRLRQRRMHQVSMASARPTESNRVESPGRFAPIGTLKPAESSPRPQQKLERKRPPSDRPPEGLKDVAQAGSTEEVLSKQDLTLAMRTSLGDALQDALAAQKKVLSKEDAQVLDKIVGELRNSTADLAIDLRKIDRARPGLVTKKSQLPPASLRPWMQVAVSTVFLGCAVVIVMSHAYDAQEKHWAYGTLGTILGFWLKGAK